MYNCISNYCIYSWVCAAFDPAGPLFENYDVSGRVDRADAAFVDVLHTASEGQLKSASSFTR